MTRLAYLVLVMLVPLFAMAAPVPKVPVPSFIVVSTSEGDVLKLDAAGKEVSRLIYKDAAIKFVRLSPDHSRLLVAARAQRNAITAKLFVHDWKTDKVIECPEAQHLDACFWMPDGKSVAASGLDIALGNQPQMFRHQCWLSWSVELTTKKESKLDIDGEYRIIGLSPDFKQYVAARTFDPIPVGNGVLAPQIETHLVDCKTLKKTLAIKPELDVAPVSLLPDGKNWIVKKISGEDQRFRFGILDTRTDEYTEFPNQTVPYDHVVLSPDGKQILASRKAGANVVKPTGQLILIDVDGLKSRKFFESNSMITSIDWR